MEQRKKFPLKTLAVVGGIGLAAYYAATAWAAEPPPPPPGKANLYGKVTDVQTGGAVSGVLIALDGLSASTDSGGNYAFTDLEPGSYSGSASKSGYDTAYF